MSRFSGPQAKGASRTLKDQRRAEAQARDALTKPERTRRYRLTHAKDA